MRKILTVSLFLSFFTGLSFAQCAMNEVEVSVEITTDQYDTLTIDRTGFHGVFLRQSLVSVTNDRVKTIQIWDLTSVHPETSCPARSASGIFP